MTDKPTIRVGVRPDPLTAEGVFFDGETAIAHQARLRVEESTQQLVIEFSGQFEAWPLDDIRSVPDQANKAELVLSLNSNPTARLITKEPTLAARCPNLKRRNSHVKRSKVAIWATGAVASVALIILVLVPLMADQLAEYIPPEGEQALGEATLEQIRGALDETGLRPLPICFQGSGHQAMAKLQARLESNVDLPVNLKVYVLDHPMINAFALPGGTIVFFDGLIQAAETPEQLAAVFAHEIGHVVSRDPTRHALRSAGSIGVLGLLFGDFAGGAAVLFLTERLIEARYSQAAEIAADRFAFNVMEKAGIPPQALGMIFGTLRQKHGDIEGPAAHFISHPKLSDRIAASDERQEVAEARGFVAAPLLTDEEWSEIKGICGRNRG